LIFKPGGIGRSGKWSISFYTSACYCINGQGHIKRFRTDGRALIWAPVIKIAKRLEHVVSQQYSTSSLSAQITCCYENILSKGVPINRQGTMP